MELYQLKTFTTVAEESHLTRAAERLNTSQPAVSAHIKALEEELGITLFERTPKGMKLTPQGVLIKQKADQVLAAAETLRFAADQLKDELTGKVRLGLHTDPQYLRVTRILAEMMRRHPKLSVSYIQKMSWEAPAELRSGNLDAAFAYARPDDDTIASHTLDRVDLVIVGPIAWENRLSEASLSDMADLPWVWTNSQCPFYKISHKLFDDLGRQPAKAVITDQESTIRKLVAAGVGLCLMTQVEASEAAAAGQLCIASPPIASLDLSLLYLKKRARDPLVTAILSAIAAAWQMKDLIAVTRADSKQSAVTVNAR
ncbi:MAG: LysR family transcriptional regulator [Desulfobacteraceae bacterium]|jgi:DNA-binding transcriptional LysR family regulator